MMGNGGMRISAMCTDISDLMIVSCSPDTDLHLDHLVDSTSLNRTSQDDLFHHYVGWFLHHLKCTSFIPTVEMDQNLCYHNYEV